MEMGDREPKMGELWTYFSLDLRDKQLADKSHATIATVGKDETKKLTKHKLNHNLRKRERGKGRIISDLFVSTSWSLCW